MKSRWVVMLLVVSIALNVAFVGFLIGRSMAPHRAFDPAAHYPRWVRSLPEPRREELRPFLRQHRQNIRPRLRAIRTGHQEVMRAILAEPFDPAMLEQALQSRRRHHLQSQDTNDAAFVEFVRQLTQQERQTLAHDLRTPNRNRQGAPAGLRP